jgi:hypothetical protein
MCCVSPVYAKSARACGMRSAPDFWRGRRVFLLRRKGVVFFSGLTDKCLAFGLSFLFLLFLFPPLLRSWYTLLHCIATLYLFSLQLF